jgi:hypothetical protein
MAVEQWKLFLNVCVGDVDAVQAAIRQRALDTTQFKDTMLVLAVANARIDVLQLLLDNVHPDFANSQRTTVNPLCVSCSNCYNVP